MPELNTDRLLLRYWRESDLGPWATMNADPEVREFLPGVLTRAESDASMTRFQADLERRGYGWWALEVRDTGDFIGFTGLDPVDAGLPFTGVEIGWRLTRSAWGHGYATEAARAVLAYGFDILALPEILAVTATGNVRSQAVMRRLGMTRDPTDDFDDPGVPEGPLRRSVLYRIRADRLSPAAATRENGEITDSSQSRYPDGSIHMTAFDRIKSKAEELAKKAKPKVEELREKAKPKVEELREKAKPKVEELREKATPLAQSLKEKAEQVGETIKTKAEDVAEGLRQGTSEGASGSAPADDSTAHKPVSGEDERPAG